MSAAGTVGSRLYQIRLACGDGLRKAESLADFAKRVKRMTKADYDPSTISLLERMKQGWRLDDVKHFAAVDPLKRGEQWLAYNMPAEPRAEDDHPDAKSKKA